MGVWWKMKLADSRVRSMKPKGARPDAYTTEARLIGRAGYDVGGTESGLG